MPRDSGIRAKLYIAGFRLNKGPKSVKVQPQRAAASRYFSDLSGVEDGPDPYDGAPRLLRKQLFTIDWPPQLDPDYLAFERIAARGGYFDLCMWKRAVVRWSGPTQTLSQFGDVSGFTLPFRTALDFLASDMLPTNAASKWPTRFWLNGDTGSPVSFTVRTDLVDAAGRVAITDGPTLTEDDVLEFYGVPLYLVRISSEERDIATSRSDEPQLVFEEG